MMEQDEQQAVVAVIAEANNSLYGSQGFFLGRDKYHLARPIEELKAAANRSWRKAEIYETALRAIMEFGFLNATSIDAARLACEALATAQAIEARSGAGTGAVHESAVLCSKRTKGITSAPAGDDACPHSGCAL